MSGKISEAKIEQDVFEFFELKRKMHRHEQEIIKLDSECGIVQNRFYSAKEYAQAALAFLENNKKKYTELYKDAYEELVMMLRDYVGPSGDEKYATGEPLGELDKELEEPL